MPRFWKGKVLDEIADSERSSDLSFGVSRRERLAIRCRTPVLGGRVRLPPTSCCNDALTPEQRPRHSFISFL